MTSQQIQTLQRVFDAPVVDHYGQTERVTLAGSCEAGGYHLFSDYAITELLPVPGKDDQWEIVGTPLHNWGFPLLRYRTGDTVGPAPAGPCPCGRSFPLLGPIGGRAEDAFTSRDGTHPATGDRGRRRRRAGGGPDRPAITGQLRGAHGAPTGDRPPDRRGARAPQRGPLLRSRTAA